MAKVILESNEKYTVAAGNTSNIIGDSSSQTVTVQAGANVEFTGNMAGDTIVLSGNGANYSAVSSGATVTLTNSITGATLVIPAVVGAATLQFDDGARELAIDTSSGTVKLGEDTVTATETSLSGETNTPSDPSEPGEGQTFMLTTGVDIIPGTAGDDIINSASGTLNNGDVIVDSTTTDNDVLNATFRAADITAAATPTISGVENINVMVDAFAGTAATFDADKVSGATITVSSTKTGFDGQAGVANVGANNATAGEGVTDFTVTGLSSGTVDLGSATTASVATATGATNSANVIVNGNVNSYTQAAVRDLNLNVTADATVNVGATGIASVTNTYITGEGDLVLRGAAANFDTKRIDNNGEGKLTVRVDNNAAADLGRVQADEIQLLAGTYGSNVTTTDGTHVKALGATATGLTLTNAENLLAAARNSEVEFTMGGNVTDLAVDGFQNVTVNMATDRSFGAIDFDHTLVLTGDNTVKFVGEGDLALATTDSTNAGTQVIDASELDGDLTYDAEDNSQTIYGATGANSIVVGDASGTGSGEVSYIGQNGGDTIVSNIVDGILAVEAGSGNDTLTIENGLTSGTIVASLGAGDDVVRINDAAANFSGGLINLDGGAGDNTLRIIDGADISVAATGSAVKNFATLQLVDGQVAGTATLVTVGGYVVNGNEMLVEGRSEIAAGGFSTGGIHLLVNDAGVTTANTIDMSGITFNALKPLQTVSVVGGTGNDTITGANIPTGAAPGTTGYINYQAGDGATTGVVDDKGGNDTIIVGSGAGITIVGIGDGTNTVDLSNSAAQNVVVFKQGTTGVDTITGWKAQNSINLSSYSDDGAAAFANAIAGVALLNVGPGDLDSGDYADSVQIINTTGAAASFTLEGTAVLNDFASANQVAAYLGERFTDTTTGAVGDDIVFILNNTSQGANKSYIWSFVDTATNTGAIDAAELTLVGIIENGGNAINTVNIDNVDVGSY